jgi:hypothetical protein
MFNLLVSDAGAGVGEPRVQRESLRSLDDSAVVARFLEGEKRAFNELVERYQGGF